MWVVAHRGGAELYPENSITAFTQLAHLGVDFVECDIHLSSDGQLVAIHDDNLRRIAGIDRAVADMRATELATVDVGDGHGVPTLAEILETVDVSVVVELKTPQTVQAMERLLREQPKYQERIFILSFYHDILLYLSQTFPGLHCGALLAGFPVDPVHVAKTAGCQMLSFDFHGLQKSYVDRCHAGGIFVGVWTPNTIEEIHNVLEAGVDGIGSDRPDLVIQAVKGGWE